MSMTRHQSQEEYKQYVLPLLDRPFTQDDIEQSYASFVTEIVDQKDGPTRAQIGQWIRFGSGLDAQALQ